MFILWEKKKLIFKEFVKSSGALPIYHQSVMSLFTYRTIPTSISLITRTQIVYLSKYISKSRTKHLPLNTKRAGKGYKKGYGARTEGRVTSTSKFIPVASMRTELVVPDLTNFKVNE